MENFNLNEYVWVKLTEKGYQHLTDMHNELRKQYNSMDAISIEYFKNKADKEGYTRFQMWDFMEKFGDFGFSMGHYLSTNIKLITK